MITVGAPTLVMLADARKPGVMATSTSRPLLDIGWRNTQGLQRRRSLVLPWNGNGTGFAQGVFVTCPIPPVGLSVLRIITHALELFLRVAKPQLSEQQCDNSYRDTLGTRAPNLMRLPATLIEKSLF